MKLRPDAEGTLGVNLTILPMFADVDYESYKDVIISSGVKAVETAGRPPGEFVSAFQNAGIKVIHKCVTTRHAKSAVQKFGVDAISLDGFECAGHPGEEVRLAFHDIFACRHSPRSPLTPPTLTLRTLATLFYRPRVAGNSMSPSSAPAASALGSSSQLCS